MTTIGPNHVDFAALPSSNTTSFLCDLRLRRDQSVACDRSLHEEREKEMTSLENRRVFTRLTIPLDAELVLDGIILTGTVRDISMGGCLMQCDAAPSIKAEGTLSLFYPTRREEMQIEARVRVVRSDANDVALEFTGVAVESYHHLRYLLMSNADDAGNVEEELVSHAGIKRRS